MNTQPGTSNWRDRYQTPNSQSAQQHNSLDIHSQQLQQNPQQQQSQPHHGQNLGRESHSEPVLTAGLPSVATLQEEITKHRRQLEILEYRAKNAEDRYNEYLTIDSTEPQQELEKVKRSSEMKYAVFDQKVRELHYLAKSQEQQLINVTTEMEMIIAELIKIKTEQAQQPPPETTSSTQMIHDIQEYRLKRDALTDKETDLRQKIADAETTLKETLQHPHSKSTADLVAYLNSAIDFNERVTGLKITKYDLKNGVGKCTFQQSGQLGNITYELEFFTDNNNNQQVLYIPLDVTGLDQHLAKSMGLELQFDLADTKVFFWRMMTHLNKPRSERQ